MNSITLQFFSILGVVFYFLLILYLLRNKRFSLKYSLTWMIFCIILAILAIFPTILDKIALLIGIATPVNALFAILFFFIIIIITMLTAIVSIQSDKIKKLIQHSALLEKRVRKLESSIQINIENN